jgi:hypothetical protein
MKRAIATLSFAALTVLNPAASAQKRQAAVHPDLSGTWSYSVDLPHVALKVETAAGTQIKEVDLSGRWKEQKELTGALPSKPAPTYKPEHLAKVKDLDEHQSKTDPVFYCGRPGVPRIGPPRRIIQLPKEIVFFYEDMSGDAYRIIPTDGRKVREDANPSYYGNSAAHWEGKVLVIESRDFVDDTWIGERGYFHTDALSVTERLWKQGADLVYQAVVRDPNVLAEPWTMAPRIVHPTDEPLEESPACKEQDADKLINNDHHGQR